MGLYIVMALITLLILLIHFLSTWEQYKAQFGETGVWVLATLGFTVGLAVWPLTLVVLVLRLLMKVKGTPGNATNS